MADPKYRRVLLKISGEALCKPGEQGIDGAALEHLAREIKLVAQLKVQLCVVVGAGNLVRGGSIARETHVEEVTGHYMGMLGTVINALAVQDTLESMGVPTRVQSAVAIDRVCERFIRRRALRHLEKGRVVIFAAGTGNPYFTTDSGAALRASEVGADVLLKATKVDGVYSADPVSNPSATLYEHLSYAEVIERRLKVIDVTAVDLCRNSRIPIVVFNLNKPGGMRAVVEGKKLGTVIGGRQ
ncbi:MAG: UMP kinase [Planctomycetes bacterium]|nr:UMP kinase [Planctomycetota bacterium]